MEVFCLGHVLLTDSLGNIIQNSGQYIAKPDDTKQVFHSRLSDSKFHHSATTTQNIENLWRGFSSI